MNLLNKEQINLILSAGVNDWFEIKDLLPEGYGKKNASNRRVTAGLPRFVGDRRRYQINENYFSDRSIESAYWAGFIHDDGCISSDTRGNAQTRLRIKLKRDDKDHLEKIATTIGGRVNEARYTNPETKVEYLSATYEISSNKITRDLLEIYNIGPAKSLTAIPPEGLSHKEELAFIAGLYDADGEYDCRGLGKRPELILVGTGPVLSWVNEKLFEGAYKITNRETWHVLSASGDRAIKARAQYIDLDLPFLSRKYRYWENNSANLELREV